MFAYFVQVGWNYMALRALRGDVYLGICGPGQFLFVFYFYLYFTAVREVGSGSFMCHALMVLAVGSQFFIL